MTYAELVQALRTRQTFDPATIDATLAAAGVPASQLVLDLFAGSQAAPGDQCPRCLGQIKVLNTRRHAGRRVQYLGCGQCGFRPPRNKLVLRSATTG